MQNFQKHKPILHPTGCAIPKASLWTMLSGGANDKEADKIIVSHLKQLCRMHKLPINKSKDIMLDTIQCHSLAGQMLVQTYLHWYRANTATLKGDSSFPAKISVPVGFAEHACGCCRH